MRPPPTGPDLLGTQLGRRYRRRRQVRGAVEFEPTAPLLAVDAAGRLLVNIGVEYRRLPRPPTSLPPTCCDEASLASRPVSSPQSMPAIEWVDAGRRRRRR